MAFTSRQQRIIGTPIAEMQTVGPGSYLQQSRPKIKPSFYGFGTTFDRLKNLNKTRSTFEVSPGPGSYICRAEVEKETKTLNNFVTKAPRLAPAFPGSTVFKASTMIENPGPGNYTLTGHTINKHTEKPKQFPKSHSSPTIINNRFNPPTIPSRYQSFGYNNDSIKGEVRPLPVPYEVHSGEKFDVVGPGHYQPNFLTEKKVPIKFATNKKTELFEKRNSYDCLMPDKENPGPGSYELMNTGKIKSTAKQEWQFCSKVKMSHQMDHMRNITTGMIGPGEYNDINVKAWKHKSTNNCFNTTERKGGSLLRDLKCPYTDSNKDVPGPANYNVQSCFSKKDKFQLIEEPIGFASTDARPCLSNDEFKVVNPGPGTYSAEEISLARGSLKKTLIGKHGVFGSCEARFPKYSCITCNETDTLNTDLHPEIITPERDNPKFKPTTSDVIRVKKGHPMFRSKTNRFRPTDTDSYLNRGTAVECPPPDSYVVRKDLGKLPRPISGKKVASFDRSEIRFPSNKNLDGSFIDDDIPGPGEYASVSANSLRLYRVVEL